MEVQAGNSEDNTRKKSNTARMAAFLARDETDGQKKIEEAKLMYLNTRSPSVHMCNNLESPRKAYPNLTNTIQRYLAKTVGVCNRSREPIMVQDAEHLIDTCGTESPQQLQMAFLISASFHAGCRQGSIVQGKRRFPEPDEIQNVQQMSLEQLNFRKENEQLCLTLTFIKEKQDGQNKSYRRPFQFTPLEEGSPYDTAKLAFLLLGVRGAFLLPPMEAFEKGDFRLREEAKEWPLICHIDQSSGKINNNKAMGSIENNFKRLVLKAGFDARKVTHHCNRSGMATTFIINEMIRNNGVFPRESISTLCRLAGWSETGGTWAIYIKDVLEKNMDGNSYLYQNLRDNNDRCQYLRNVKTNFNYRLVPPEKNLETLSDCMECADFQDFLNQFRDDVLQGTVMQATEGLKLLRENKEEEMFNGLTKEGLEKRLKAVKLRAVAQFATARNNEKHDYQWSLPCAPNPNKEHFREALQVGEYLQRYLRNAEKDLALRRFSPIDYTMPLVGPVKCPFAGCSFLCAASHLMIEHQKVAQHRGWKRYEDADGGRNWVCPKEGCGAAFFKWDHLYKHMQGHSKPLGCPSCPFRTDRLTRLKKHMEECDRNEAGDIAGKDRGHWSRKRGSAVLMEE